MAAFHEVRFPEDVSWGSSGGPRFKTHVFETHKGYEYRNCEWQQPMMEFNVAYGIRTDSQILRVINFFNARQGRLHGFRYKNWGNYRIVGRPIATGDGFSTRLPLYKFYGPQAAKFYKRIRKIVAGSVSDVFVGGTPLVEGIDFNIDYNAGEIALNNAPGFGVPVYGTLEFDEPVRFEEDSIQNVIDAYNSNSFNSLVLTGIRGTFSEGSVFEPQIAGDNIDPHVAFTKTILNFDWTGTPTATQDSSAAGLPVTLIGGAEVTNTAFATGSGALDTKGTGHAQVSGATINASVAPFTMEIYTRLPSEGADLQYIIAKADEATDDRCFALRYQVLTGVLQFCMSLDGTAWKVVCQTTYRPSAPTDFVFISVDRTSAGWFTLRAQGIVLSRVRDTSSFHDAAVPVTFGGKPPFIAGEGNLNAIVDAARITVGRSRYSDSGEITPPASYGV